MVGISNMDMPKSCMDCKLCKDYISKVWCAPTGNALVRWDVLDKRDERCPLVELIDKEIKGNNI